MVQGTSRLPGGMETRQITKKPISAETNFVSAEFLYCESCIAESYRNGVLSVKKPVKPIKTADSDAVGVVRERS